MNSKPVMVVWLLALAAVGAFWMSTCQQALDQRDAQTQRSRR